MTHADNMDFRAGLNIATKVLAYAFNEASRFYRDAVGLQRLPSTEASVTFHFGRIRLWIDGCPRLSRIET